MRINHFIKYLSLIFFTGAVILSLELIASKILTPTPFYYALQKSAQGGTWTPTALRPTDFKSAASTNSATRANQIIYYSTLGIESRKL